MPNDNPIITDYDPDFTKKIENALLDIWGRLGEYRDYLVLIGGLAPRYITAPSGSLDYTSSLHCGTMDIDLGISLAVADQEKYKAIYDILTNAGFVNAKNSRGNKKHHSFVKGSERNAIIIDFLTTKYEGPDNSLMHKVFSDISAIQTFGMGLALKNYRQCKISGINEKGDQVQETINVCRPVAYIVLKALAFDDRRKDKDVYDLVFVLEHYLSGISAVAAEITEGDLQEKSFRAAMDCLERHFSGVGYSGPRAYERFCQIPNTSGRAYATVREFIDKVHTMQ